MKEAKKTLNCPQCGAKRSEQEQDKDTKPFCSKRCKMIDLGKWLSEKYVIATSPLEQSNKIKAEDEDE